MARRRSKLTIVLCAAVLLTAGFVIIRFSERNSLHARVERILLRDMAGNADKWDEGMDALWALGPDIIPCLADEAGREDNWFSKHYAQTWRKSPAWLKRRLPRPTDPAELRKAAMHALAEFGPLAARRAAPRILAEMGQKDFWLQNGRVRLAHWLVPDSKAALAAFEYGLADTDTNWPTPDYFVVVADDFIWPRVPEILPLLTNLLRYPGMADGVAVALSRMGSNAAPAIPALIQTLDMGAAGFTNAKDLHDHMFEAIYNPFSGHRATIAVEDKMLNYNRADAAYALGRIGVATPEACAALARAWNFPDPGVRLQAADAVALLGPLMTNELPALLRGLKDSDISALDSKLEAIQKIGPAAHDALETLRELTDTNVVLPLVLNKPANDVGLTVADLSAAAKIAVCAVDPEQGRALLPDIVSQIGHRSDPTEFLTRRGPLSNDIVRIVEPMLDETDTMRRGEAAYVILFHNPRHPKALAVLRENRSTSDIRNRLAAGWSLYESIGETNGLCDIITEILQDQSSPWGQAAADTADKMGTNALPALPAIKAALWHKDPFVREQAGALILKLAPEELPMNESK